jgi:hypothetical protein
VLASKEECILENTAEFPAAIIHPGSDEYAEYYGRYIALVPSGSLITLLDEQGRDTAALLAGIPEAKAGHRYAPGKWSIKEVIGHITDAERVFSYRALSFARGETAPLPSFDENAWAPAGRFDRWPLARLARGLDAVRRATIELFSTLDADALARRGTASGWGVSVRALAYIIAGHERHHVKILKERYLA